MSKKHDELLGHASDNDGIDEYDNPLPDWWLGLFYFTIIFGVIYGIDYHFVSHRSQTNYYESEMASAAEQWPDFGKSMAVTMSPEVIAKGQEIYAANCVPCHGPELKGGIGPDLTDTEWIHGGSPEDITKTITDGVPAKGMLTWGPILGPEKISQVTAFVISKGQSN